MSPQLGQGCNLALIDAERLVDCLEQHSNTESGDTESDAFLEKMPTILEEYTKMRWAHIQFYAFQSRILTPMFASRSELLCFFRDNFMAKLCTTPIITTFVHGVLCGAQSTIPFKNIPEKEWLGFLDDEIEKEKQKETGI